MLIPLAGFNFTAAGVRGEFDQTARFGGKAWAGYQAGRGSLQIGGATTQTRTSATK